MAWDISNGIMQQQEYDHDEIEHIRSEEIAVVTIVLHNRIA